LKGGFAGMMSVETRESRSVYSMSGVEIPIRRLLLAHHSRTGAAREEPFRLSQLDLHAGRFVGDLPKIPEGQFVRQLNHVQADSVFEHFPTDRLRAISLSPPAKSA